MTESEPAALIDACLKLLDRQAKLIEDIRQEISKPLTLDSFAGASEETLSYIIGDTP